ncbi:MAG: response regulator [Chloroflexota bacterium]
MSILIVDDNAISAKMVEVSLQRNGYQTVVATSGAVALDLLGDMLDVQLVILDIMMPDMDGLTLLNFMRERADLSELPVILCTARTDPDTVTKAAFLGCKKIVSKPIRLADLLAKVREETSNERPVLQDRFRVMSKIGVDFQTYKDVVQAFSTVVDERIRGFEAVSPPVAPIEVADLREGAELIGAERLAAIIQRIEAMTVAPGAPEDLEMQQSMLLRELRLLQAPLQQVLAQT